MTLTVDTFNVALAGNFIPYEDERRQPIIDALAALDSDIVCLQEVWEQSDKDLIKEAMKAKFPHVVFEKHDLSTPVEDAAGIDGVVPEPFTTPPCPDGPPAEYDNKLDAAVECLKKNCSDDPGADEQGHTISASCPQSKCVSAASGLLFASDKRCYGCLAPQLPTATFAEIREECKNNPLAGLAFKGQSGVMLLSKHPLDQTDVVVVPGTWNRRAMIKARASLPNGSKLDVYCHHLAPIFKGSFYPYTGQYGAGPDSNKWANEQLLHAKKLTAYVQKNTCGPAVILGDMNASRADASATPPVQPEGLATLDELEKVFSKGVAAGYKPACTYCKANMNVDDNDSGGDQWIDHIYLYNIDPKSVTSTERTFTAPVVEVTVSGSGGASGAGGSSGASGASGSSGSSGSAGAGGASTIKVELSDHYGLRSVIKLGQ